MQRKFYIHSCYSKAPFGDFVVVKESIEQEDGTLVPNLKVFKNPKRCFYVTKEYRRTHTFKKEFEVHANLDKYRVYNYELLPAIRKVLGYGRNYPRTKVFANPYLYGADIDIESLIKISYFEHYQQKELPKYSYGFLDIETCVKTKDIIAITFIAQTGETYTGCLSTFMYDVDDRNIRKRFTTNDVKQLAESKLDKYVKDLGLKFFVAEFETPVEIIRWIFDKIHKHKLDFIGIWNINFDIPRINETLEEAGIPLADIYSAPELAPEYRVAKYVRDNSRPAHFSQKWNWMKSTSHSQFIDSMSVYSNCRKTQPALPSYKLDYILNLTLGERKIELESGSHYVMQQYRFKDYLIYNMFDCIAILMMENKTGDIQLMGSLSGVTPVEKFPRQTVKSRNNLYMELKSMGIIGTASKYEDFRKVAKVFKNAGGSVLAPELTRNTGVHIMTA